MPATFATPTRRGLGGGNLTQWWGKGPRNEHYGETLAAIREGGPKTRDRLLALATDRDRSGIVRATAFSEIPRLGPDASVEPTLTAGFADADPLVREEAVAALESFPPQVRVRLGCALLQDPVRAVRVEAARVLAAARSLMNEEQGRAFDTAGAEYLERMEAISDRAAGHAGRGCISPQLGKPKEAEDAYRTAFEVDHRYRITGQPERSDAPAGPDRGGRGAASGCDRMAPRSAGTGEHWRMMRSRGVSSAPSAMRRRWRKCGRR
ncbi:MAG: hypothetical protein R3F31_07830 [Verrucomicrobiales bacterium]